MELTVSKSKQTRSIEIEAVARLIMDTQRECGEIPYCRGDKTDPWDMVEAAMGLHIGGYFSEAGRAFDWLAQNQLEDGSWYSSYIEGIPEDRTRDANITSYIAVGAFHYYLTTGDLAFLKEMWKTVSAAIDFALSLQADSGEIYWAISPEGRVDHIGLLTGSSSVYMSLKCALSTARLLDHRRPAWEEGLENLGQAIKYRRHLFNMTKSRYSMDWFYPILCGALTGAEAQKRIDISWDKFVIKGQGVLCVSDRPWVTLAETSELVLALSAMGNQNLSQIVFNWIQDRRYEDGSYWSGFTYPDMIIWPDNKLTWTNAVVLMAADALYNLTPASQLFNHNSWNSSWFSPLD